jgi:hypothetical protein
MTKPVDRALALLLGAPFCVSKGLEAGAITGRDTTDAPEAGGAALKTESLDPDIRPMQGRSNRRKKSKRRPDAITKALGALTGSGKHRAPVSVTRHGKTHIEMRLVGTLPAQTAAKPGRMMTAATATPTLARTDYEALATALKDRPNVALRAHLETIVDFWDDSFITRLVASTQATAQKAIHKLAARAPQAYVDLRALKQELIGTDSFEAPVTVRMRVSATNSPTDAVTFDVGASSGTFHLLEDNHSATEATRALVDLLTEPVDVLKGHRRLRRKLLTDKRGHRTTRWVRADEAAPFRAPKVPVPAHIGLALLEKRAAAGDWRDITQAYRQQHPRTLDPDELREQLRPYGYNRRNVDDFVRFSSAAGNQILNRALARLEPGQNVRLIMGLPGAGKSTALRYLEQLSQAHELDLPPVAFTYDGAMINATRMHEVIDAIIAKGATPHVLYVHNAPERALRQAIGRYLAQGRPMTWGFFSVATDAYRDRLDQLVQLGDRIQLQVVDNSGAAPRRVPPDQVGTLPAVSEFTLDQYAAILHEHDAITEEEKTFLITGHLTAGVPLRDNTGTPPAGRGGQKTNAGDYPGAGLSGVIQKALAALLLPAPRPAADPVGTAWLDALDPIEKARAVPVGTITRLTDGRMSIKTPRGWRIYHGTVPKKRRKPKKIATNFSHNGKNYHIDRESATGPLLIRREDGSPYVINSPQRRALINAYVETHKAEWKKRKFVRAKPGMMAEDYARIVAQKSVNPMEVALEWLSLPPATLTPQEEVLRDWMLPTNPESWARWADNNHFKGNAQLRRNYLSREADRGSHRALDVQAADISEHSGIEVTPQDMVDFALRWPGGPKTATAENPLRDSLGQRFEHLTGLPLTGDVALTLTQIDRLVPRKTRAKAPAPAMAPAAPPAHGDGHQPLDADEHVHQVLTGPATPTDRELEHAFASLFGTAPASSSTFAFAAAPDDDAPF